MPSSKISGFTSGMFCYYITKEIIIIMATTWEIAAAKPVTSPTINQQQEAHNQKNYN